MPRQVRTPGCDLSTMHSGRPTQTHLSRHEPGDCHTTGEGEQARLQSSLTDPPWAHPTALAAAHQMSEWPARVGALGAGRDQQLGHALVRALLRRGPLDLGPVEPHRVRGPVPVCYRL